MAIWEATVRIKGIPVYVLPAPSAVLATLNTGLVGPVRLVAYNVADDSGRFHRSSRRRHRIGAPVQPLEVAGVFVLFPMRSFFSTPVIAIAPLLLIYLPQHVAVVVCAWIVAFFPVLSNTTLGLNSVDRNLLGLFELYGATRAQTLRYLKLPSAMPHILGGLRIAGGLSLIGAVVAEIAAWFCGRGIRPSLQDCGIRLPAQHPAHVRGAAAAVRRRDCDLYGPLARGRILCYDAGHESALGKEN